MEVRPGAVSLLGTTIDETIEIQSVLGSGGMGTVYKGFHKLLERPVAVKILSTNTSETLQRFKVEAESLFALQHRNIVKILRFGVLNENSQTAIPYLVLEYVEGKSLQTRLAESPLELESIWNVLKQVTSGVSAAHQANIVHRDIKPSNIMLADDVIKIVDFGISKSLTPTDIQKLTQTGALLGTPLYMSPEQLASKSPGTESDVYSIGCVLFEMLYGKPYALGDNIVEIAISKVNPSNSIEHSTASGAAVPKALRDLLAKMLSPEPEHRIQNAIELNDLIAKVYANPNTIHGELTPRAPTTKPPATGIHRSVFALIASTCIAGLLAMLTLRQASSDRADVLKAMNAACTQARSAPPIGNNERPDLWSKAVESVKKAQLLTDDESRDAVTYNIRMLAQKRLGDPMLFEDAGQWLLRQAASLPASQREELLQRFDCYRFAFSCLIAKYKELPQQAALNNAQLRAVDELFDGTLATAAQLDYKVPSLSRDAINISIFVIRANELLNEHHLRFFGIRASGRDLADGQKAAEQGKALLSFINHNPNYFRTATPADMQQLARQLLTSFDDVKAQKDSLAFTDSLTSGPASELWKTKFEGHEEKLLMMQAAARCIDGYGAEAESRIKQALSLLEQQHRSSPDLDVMHVTLAQSFLHQTRYEEALKELHVAFEISSRKKPIQPDILGDIKTWEANCLAWLNKPAEARDALRAARAYYSQVPMPYRLIYENQMANADAMIESVLERRK